MKFIGFYSTLDLVLDTKVLLHNLQIWSYDDLNFERSYGKIADT